jgi:hypothetical protein
MQNQKTQVAAVLGAAVLMAGIFAAATTPITAYADKDNEKKDKGDVSKTITKEKLKQKNVGSGNSENTNCGDSTIMSLTVGICPSASVFVGPPVE